MTVASYYGLNTNREAASHHCFVPTIIMKQSSKLKTSVVYVSVLCFIGVHSVVPLLSLWSAAFMESLHSRGKWPVFSSPSPQKPLLQVGYGSSSSLPAR